MGTSRAYDNCMQKFSDMLANQATANTTRRGSRTPTEADVEDAFRFLTRITTTGTIQRVCGDALMILGGIFLPLWETTVLLTLAGAILCAAGLFLREYSG